MKTGVAACLLLVVLGAMVLEHSEATLIKSVILANALKKKAAYVHPTKVVEVPAPVAKKTGKAKEYHHEPEYYAPGHVESAVATKTALLGAAVDSVAHHANTVVATKTAAAQHGLAALGKGKSIIGSTIDKLIAATGH